MDFKDWNYLAMLILTFVVSSAFGANPVSEKEPANFRELFERPEDVVLHLVIEGKEEGKENINHNDNFKRIAGKFGVECLSLKPINDEMEERDLLYNKGTFTELTVEAYLLEHGERKLRAPSPNTTTGRFPDGKYHLNVHGSKTAMVQVDLGVQGNERKKKHITRSKFLSAVGKSFTTTSPLTFLKGGGNLVPLSAAFKSLEPSPSHAAALIEHNMENLEAV